jgi:hypothetical protein
MTTPSKTFTFPLLEARGAVFTIEGVQPLDVRGATIEIDVFEKAEKWSNGDIFLLDRKFAVRVDPRTIQFVART